MRALCDVLWSGRGRRGDFGPFLVGSVRSAALVCPLLSYLTCSLSPIHCFDMTRFLARHSNSRFRWHFGWKDPLIGKNMSTPLTFRNRPHTHMHECPVYSCVCTLTSTCGLTAANCNGVLFCFVFCYLFVYLFCFVFVPHITCSRHTVGHGCLYWLRLWTRLEWTDGRLLLVSSANLCSVHRLSILFVLCLLNC